MDCTSKAIACFVLINIFLLTPAKAESWSNMLNTINTGTDSNEVGVVYQNGGFHGFNATVVKGSDGWNTTRLSSSTQGQIDLGGTNTEGSRVTTDGFLGSSVNVFAGQGFGFADTNSSGSFSATSLNGSESHAFGGTTTGVFVNGSTPGFTQ